VFWLVLEGDNGTGKDTIRALLETAGWAHVDGGTEADAALALARQAAGWDRVPAYLRYCHACAEAANRVRADRVTVRYWPSTLAAGYADRLIDDAELDRMADDCIRRFPAPDGVAELRCAFGARVERILCRGPQPLSPADNMDPGRGDRLRAALDRVAARWPRPWTVIDTTSLAPEQVLGAVRAWADIRRGR
jgi:thymidylate kinase